jgi:serine-type D-Ala-D-Ala endopeptidase (penicillin-binding protein 7)
MWAVLLAMAPIAGYSAEDIQRVDVNYVSAPQSRPVTIFAHQMTLTPGAPAIRSVSALVIDQSDGGIVYDKNTDKVAPIASITKLMTAMVTLDAGLPLDDVITISADDIDTIKNTHSRLTVGTGLLRRDMLRLALMSSENRAAAALGRTYPGGTKAIVKAMNNKAVSLGMLSTHFVDPTGLNSENVSTAADLAKMVNTAYQYGLIREFTTTSSHSVETIAGRSMQFRNSNRLVKSSQWEIGLSKTGYISEAGRCLVMQARIAARQVVIVLLDSWGKYTRLGDANRIKKWLEGRSWHKIAAIELSKQ